MLKSGSFAGFWVTLAFAGLAQGAPQYIAEQLTPLPGYPSVEPTAINDSGEILGASSNPNGTSETTVWIDLQPSVANPWPGGNPGSYPVALDDAGDVLGTGPETYVYSNSFYDSVAFPYGNQGFVGVINGGEAVGNYQDASGLSAITIWDANGVTYTQPFQSLSSSNYGTFAVATSLGGGILGGTYDIPRAIFVSDAAGRYYLSSECR